MQNFAPMRLKSGIALSIVLTAICSLSGQAADGKPGEALRAKFEQKQQQLKQRAPRLRSPFDAQWQLFECPGGAANFVDVPNGTGFDFGTRGASLYSDEPKENAAASCKFVAPANPNFECRRLQFLMRADGLERAFVRVTCIFKNSRTGGEGGSFTLRADTFDIDRDQAHPGWFQYTIDPRNFPPEGVLDSITFNRVDGPRSAVIVGATQVTLRSNVTLAPDRVTTIKGRCQDIPN